MGASYSLSSSALKEQQRLQAETQLLVLERQMQLQNLRRERAEAMEFARLKERFVRWEVPFTILTSAMLIYQFNITKNKLITAPLWPLYMVVAHNAEAIYGDKAECIRKYAETALREEEERFAMPLGPITIDDIEDRRLAQADQDMFRPHEAFL